MRVAGVDLADVLRAAFIDLAALATDLRKAVDAILACRTAEAGGHRRTCSNPDCGHQEIAYNSCGNRHCPKCGWRRQVEWLAKQAESVLPVPYHHVVFTVPEVLKPIFLSNRQEAYDLLFEAVSETLREVAAKPCHLGATIGFTAILHTWTQKLDFHPHIHCIVPSGGLTRDGRWRRGRGRFFLPIEILWRVFRGKLLAKFEAAMLAGRLPGKAPGDLAALRAASRKRWVVFCKTPTVGAGQVLAYLSRYTFRVAISNSRLLSLRDGRVRFRYKDRANGNGTREMTLSVAEFARRFLLHVLPKGFMRIRHFGFLASATKAKALPRCREAIGERAPAPAIPAEAWDLDPAATAGASWLRCPQCHSPMTITEWLAPDRVQWLVQGAATAS